MKKCLPHHLQDVHFALDGPVWTPEVISALGDVLVQYADRFAKSNIDLGHCATLPFGI